MNLNFLKYQQNQYYYPTAPSMETIISLKNYIESYIQSQPVPQYTNFTQSSSTTAFSPSVNQYADYHHDDSPSISPYHDNLSISSNNNLTICLEAQIKYLVQFFIQNYGIIRMKDMVQERQKYVHNDTLLKVFDALGKKYSACKKPREELVKWIVRRVLMEGKQNIKGGAKMSQKTVSVSLCKRYALVKTKKEQGVKIEEDFEESINGCVGEILPYKKDSKIKTINTQFVDRIFESQEFQHDYENFLKNFDEIIEKDTEEKMNRFVLFVVQCASNGKINEIAKYKRVPWLKSWAEKTKTIAFELEDASIEKRYWKQVKTEYSS